MRSHSVEQLVVEPAPRARRSPWKALVMGRLAAIGEGRLTLLDGGCQEAVGHPAGDGLSARLIVDDPRFWRRIALGGTLGAAESFARGEWRADDLTAVVRVFARNLEDLEKVESGLARLAGSAARAAHVLRRNTRRGSQRNIAAHYDLGNDFFALMLDPTLTYSCAVFERADATLEEASVAKLDRLCRALRLAPSDHLLEIGTGWGSMALHAAGRYGCRVTTATLSRSQHDLARARVRQAGLEGRVEVLLRDYRDLRGRFDKLVSVEMIEAVGAEFYPDFFAACARLLVPDGLMALQAITIADRRFERARREVDFIKRHIFPGSCIPSVTALLAEAARGSDLRLVGLDDITRHYPTTLAAWRANLAANRNAVARLTTARFRRLWEFYLAYCEGGFLERRIGTVQMLLARPRWRD